MLSVVIQAGGQSSRMGEDKALRSFLGRPLIQRVAGRLLPAADEMLVTTNRPAGFQFLGLPLFADVMPGRGALGGLLTALASAREPLVAVVACDMPFASAALIENMAGLLIAEDVDVVIAETEGGLEPLHAVYRRAACLPAIEAAIGEDQWKAVAWLPRVRVRVLTAEELKRWDPEGLAFWNVNTPEEFARAEALASAHDQYRAGGV
ncbi:MAG TPA: molybdenum cofactor guanylyltransferase [Anaerolineales bacterium]